MAKAEIEAFISYADELVAATRNHTMEWTRVNPTTFTWTTQRPSPASLTLQVVENKTRKRDVRGMVVEERVTHFVFQAIDQTLPPNVPQRLKLTISSADEPDAKPKLQELYDCITTGISQTGLDFLKAMLPPLER